MIRTIIVNFLFQESFTAHQNQNGKIPIPKNEGDKKHNMSSPLFALVGKLYI